MGIKDTFHWDENVYREKQSQESSATLLKKYHSKIRHLSGYCTGVGIASGGIIHTAGLSVVSIPYLLRQIIILYRKAGVIESVLRERNVSHRIRTRDVIGGVVVSSVAFGIGHEVTHGLEELFNHVCDIASVSGPPTTNSTSHFYNKSSGSASNYSFVPHASTSNFPASDPLPDPLSHLTQSINDALGSSPDNIETEVLHQLQNIQHAIGQELSALGHAVDGDQPVPIAVPGAEGGVEAVIGSESFVASQAGNCALDKGVEFLNSSSCGLRRRGGMKLQKEEGRCKKERRTRLS